MPVGSTGVAGDGKPLGGQAFDQIMDLVKFIGNPDVYKNRLDTLAKQEATVDEKLRVLGGLEHARELLAEAAKVEKAAKTEADMLIKDALAKVEASRNKINDERRAFEVDKNSANKAIDFREARLAELEEMAEAKLKNARDQDHMAKSYLAQAANDKNSSASLRYDLEEKIKAIKKIAG